MNSLECLALGMTSGMPFFIRKDPIYEEFANDHILFDVNNVLTSYAYFAWVNPFEKHE